MQQVKCTTTGEYDKADGSGKVIVQAGAIGTVEGGMMMLYQVNFPGVGSVMMPMGTYGRV